MYLVNGLDGVKVVDAWLRCIVNEVVSRLTAGQNWSHTWVQANLVHDGNAGCFGLGVELEHGRRDVAGGDHILLVADGRLDDGGVEGVGDQADDQVVLGHLGVQRLVVGHVERDGMRVLDALGELLGRGQGAAGCVLHWSTKMASGMDDVQRNWGHTNRHRNAGITEDVESRSSHETRTEHKHLPGSGKPCQLLCKKRVGVPGLVVIRVC